MKKAQAEKIMGILNDAFQDESIERDYSLDVETLQGINSVDEIIQYLEDRGFFDREVIYSDDAMEYLAQHDPSLIYSLEIAKGYGLTTDSLNSEILASLLLSHGVQERYAECVKQMKQVLS